MSIVYFPECYRNVDTDEVEMSEDGTTCFECSVETKAEIVEQRNCSFCGKSITGFKDELSETEFRISGMCQECQDDIFEEDSE